MSLRSHRQLCPLQGSVVKTLMLHQLGNQLWFKHTNSLHFISLVQNPNPDLHLRFTVQCTCPDESVTLQWCQYLHHYPVSSHEIIISLHPILQ